MTDHRPPTDYPDGRSWLSSLVSAQGSEDESPLTDAEVNEARSDLAAFERLVFGLYPRAFHLAFVEAVCRRNGRSVFVSAVGHGKTYQATIVAPLWVWGHDTAARFLLVAASSGKASESLGAVGDVLLGIGPVGIRYRQVFPHVQLATRRNPGSSAPIHLRHDGPPQKDPSYVAYGLDPANIGPILGAHPTHILIDDVTGLDDVWSEYQRTKKLEALEGAVFSRPLPGTSITMLANAWHPRDAAHVVGGREGWDLVKHPAGVRLPDGTWVDLLWPFDGQYGRTADDLEELWQTLGPVRGDALLGCRAPEDADARCSSAWTQAALAKGDALSEALRSGGGIPGGTRIVTGVDLAVGKSQARGDFAVLATCAAFPYPIAGCKYAVLDVRSGRWKGPDTLDRMVQVHEEYARWGHRCRCETNGAQEYLVQFAQAQGVGKGWIEGRPTTSANKHDPVMGVEAWFADLARGEWGILPSEEGKRLAADAVTYSPDAHTPDRLIALWIAREALWSPASATRIGESKPPACARGWSAGMLKGDL
jgi:hypothetical protein